MEKIIKTKQKKEQPDYQASNQLKQQINNFLLNYFDWIILIIVSAILAAGFFVIIKPKYELISKDIELFKMDKEGDYLIHEAYLTKLNELKNTYNSISQADKDKIDIILPEKVEAEKLFAQMETLINQSNFTLTSLKIIPEKIALSGNNATQAKAKTKQAEQGTDKQAELESDDLIAREVGEINITMNIIGTDYNGLKKLLSLIENNLRLMDVEKISWSPVTNSTQLQLVIYFHIDHSI